MNDAAERRDDQGQQEKGPQKGALGVMRWIACLPLGLFLGIVAPWLLSLWFRRVLEETLLDLLPEPLFSTIPGTLGFFFGGAIAVFAVAHTAPSKKQVVAGIVAGVLGIASVLIVIGTVVSRSWWNISLGVALGIGALGAAFAQSNTNTDSKSDR
jgi:peptidoglycan/LPS O-acetylase OafA/YrhL